MYQFEEDYNVGEPPGPNAKIFFQVVIDYNPDLVKSMISEENVEHIESMGPLESSPLGSYDEADEMVKDTIEQIHLKFPGSSIKELEPEDQEDEYHIYVHSTNGDAIAKVGVIAIDYTNATIH